MTHNIGRLMSPTDEVHSWSDPADLFPGRADASDGPGKETRFAPVESALPAWLARIEEANAWLAKYVYASARVDELAILFPTQGGRRDFIDAAVMEPKMTHFNAAVDRVHTSPLDTNYGVRYDFLQHQDVPWRIECMALLWGHSPLHEALLERARTQQVVHLSFRTLDLIDYDEACEKLAKVATLAQGCESTYGSFSYWMPKVAFESGAKIYIKPRLNRRDSR